MLVRRRFGHTMVLTQLKMIRMNTFSHMILTTAVLLLSGCLNGTAPEKTAQPKYPNSIQRDPKTFVYECSDAFSFVARIENNTVWLFLPHKTLNLPQVPSGYGAKFSDNLSAFWAKGDTATLYYNNVSYRNCKNNRRKAIWEHAKLNGVDFRAVGNEPGWYLEIRNQETILFVGDYGTVLYEFATPEPMIDRQERRTTYQTKADGKNLTIIIEGRPCRDTMSGESFDTSVHVALDHQRFQGCGRALH